MTSISDGGALASELFDCIIDCGASCPVSPVLSDFADFAEVPPDTQKVLKGLATGLEIRGEGILAYSCQLADGGAHVFRAKGIYVPESPRRLFSPQFYLQKLSAAEKAVYKDPKFVIRAEQMTAELTPSLVIPVPYLADNNLPVLRMYNANSVQAALAELNVCVLDEKNQNLSASQKVLLKLHFQHGHRSMQHLQQLLKTGALGATPINQAASCCKEIPKCASCQFGKARRRSSGPKFSVQPKEKILSQSVLFPVSVSPWITFLCLLPQWDKG